MTGRILRGGQKRLFADRGTQISGGSDRTVRDLVGQAFADFPGNATTGNRTASGIDDASANGFHDTLAERLALGVGEALANALQGLDGVRDVGEGFGYDSAIEERN